MITPSSPVKLAYLVSHPIQYQAPLLKRIAAHPAIDLKVFFRSDKSVAAYRDPGFGQQVSWDTPLLEGYDYEFLPAWGGIHRTSNFLRPFSHGLARRLVEGEFEALWVHGYAPVFHWQALTIAKLMGLKTLLRDETWIDARQGGWMKDAFFAAIRQVTDAVLPIGRFNDEYWARHGFRPERRFLVPYAVDNERFAALAAQASPRREELRRNLGLQPGRPIILFVAKLIAVKAPELLLRAVANLQSTQPAPYLLFAGSGELQSSLEQEAKILNLGDAMRFLGFRNQSELPALYDLCDVFCLPSRKEPWGLVVNEVMNAGKAVVVSDKVGSGGNLVEDGVNGRIFPTEEILALTNALRDCLQPGVAARMGAASRQKIQRWSFDQDMEGLLAALAALFPDRFS